MSTVVVPNTSVDETAGVPDQEIRVYGHSTLFYWWPMWAACFLLALFTYLDGQVMAVVPAGTPCVSHTLPPTTEPLPMIVSPPRIVAPA